MSRIHTEAIGLVSMKLGGGRATKEDVIDPAVGLVLRKKVGDHAEAGETLAVVHAADPERAAEASSLVRECFEFSDKPAARPPFIRKILRET